MKKTRVAIAALLLASMSMTMFACDDKEESSYKSLDSATAAEVAQIAAEDSRLTGELENKTIKWMANWDINPDSSGKEPPIELAIFQSRYGGVVQWYSVEWNTRYDSLANAVNGGEGVDFFPASDLDAFPKGAIKDMFAPIDDYIDFNNELWADTKDVMDQFTWGGKHYVIVNAVSGDNCAVIYNKNTIAEHGLKDPAELLEKGEWNWKTFQEQLEQFVDVEEGYYGLDGYWFENGLSRSTGVPYIGIENGKLVSNLKDPNLERLQNWFFELSTNNLVAIGCGDFGWNEMPQYIGEGKELYFPAGLWKLYSTPDKWEPTFGDAEDVMFVPVPKDPESDTYYIPCGLDGYVMVKGGQNPEGVAKFAECKRVTITNERADAIATEQLYDVYGWTEEMVQMKIKMDEMARANPVYDFYTGTSADVTKILDSSENGIRTATKGQIQWSETVGTISSAIDAYLAEYNATQN